MNKIYGLFASIAFVLSMIMADNKQLLAAITCWLTTIGMLTLMERTNKRRTRLRQMKKLK